MANPTGINQYTKGGGTGKLQAKYHSPFERTRQGKKVIKKSDALDAAGKVGERRAYNMKIQVKTKRLVPRFRKR